jgi:hypothetical protein
MQPHFLFNALNTISSLMYSDVARADAMLVQLSDVLRATLDVGERHLVPLETELRILRGYAALMGERFADRVSIAGRSTTLRWPRSTGDEHAAAVGECLQAHWKSAASQQPSHLGLRQRYAAAALQDDSGTLTGVR